MTEDSEYHEMLRQWQKDASLENQSALELTARRLGHEFPWTMLAKFSPWRELIGFFNAVIKHPITEENAIGDSELEDAEKKFGSQLPGSIRNFFRCLGHSEFCMVLPRLPQLVAAKQKLTALETVYVYPDPAEPGARPLGYHEMMAQRREVATWTIRQLNQYEPTISPQNCTVPELQEVSFSNYVAARAPQVLHDLIEDDVRASDIGSLQATANFGQSWLNLDSDIEKLHAGFQFKMHTSPTEFVAFSGECCLQISTRGQSHGVSWIATGEHGKALLNSEWEKLRANKRNVIRIRLKKANYQKHELAAAIQLAYRHQIFFHCKTHPHHVYWDQYEGQETFVFSFRTSERGTNNGRFSYGNFEFGFPDSLRVEVSGDFGATFEELDSEEYDFQYDD